MRKPYILIFLLISAMCTAQTNYYVDAAGGSNSNNGLTLATAWKTIQKACNAATPNSVVHIKGGTYHENLTLNVSGTPGNPIVFTNYQNDDVLIDGGGVTGTILLSVIAKSHVTFENLLFQNLTAAHAKGINVEAGTGTCDGLTFKNLTIKDISCLDDPDQMPGESDNAWGLKVKGQAGGVTNLIIEDCKIYGNILGYSEAMTISGDVDGFIVRNCTIHDNTNIGIDIIGHNGSSSDPETDWPRNGVISGNTCYRNVCPVAQSAGIYVDGAENITIERNNCFENQVGIEVGCEDDGVAQYIKVKNNLIYNNQFTGLAVGGYTTATTGEVLYSTFRNNTLFQNNSLNTGMGEITVSKASNCVFEDNLVYSNNQNVLLTMLEIQPQENNIINYNCWYTPSGNVNNIIVYWGESTFHSMATYMSATGQDSNSMYTNPVLANIVLAQLQCELLGVSQCINQGNPVLQVSPGETDFDGNPRIIGTRIDIGAFEFNPSLGLGITAAKTATAAPNPFSTQTKIRSVSELNNASLLLYDISGRLVRQLNALSGYEATLEKNDLKAGIYVYKIFQDGRMTGSGKLSVQ